MIFAKKIKYIPRPKSDKSQFWIKQKILKTIGSLSTKRKRDSMGEIELKFNFDTESRGALFAPRQSYIYTIFTPEPCEAQRGRRRGT